MNVLFDWVIDCFRAELGEENPNIARLSIILGLLERCFTTKERSSNLSVESLRVRNHEGKLNSFHDRCQYFTSDHVQHSK